MINIIACIDLNGGLGLNNQLLYHIPEDLKRFKQLTQNQVVVIGKNTLESIGKTLPNRINIVLTRDSSYKSKYGELVANSIEDCIALANRLDKDLCVCGGSEIYSSFIGYADNIYLTVVHESHKPSDTFYPRSKQDSLRFTLDSHESHYSDKYNAIYSYKTYSRKE